MGLRGALFIIIQTLIRSEQDAGSELPAPTGQLHFGLVSAVFGVKCREIDCLGQ